MDNSVDLFPGIAMALFEATSVEWTTEVEERDYARSIRRWVEASIRGAEYALIKVLLAQALKEAHDKYWIESEKMEDLEFEYLKGNLIAAQTRAISQQVQSAGGEWIQAARNYYKFRPVEYSQTSFQAIIGPEEMFTGQGLEEVLQMLERRPKDKRATDYLTITVGQE